MEERDAAYQRDLVYQVVESVLAKMGIRPAQTRKGPIPVGVSNRHVHLSRPAIDVLFGPGYELTCLRELSQPGQFVASETVTLVGPKGVLPGVRILGPARSATQVEISRTDAFALGLDPPVRDSAQLEGTPGVTLAGPCGAVVLPRGVILALRHIHMHPADVASFGVKDGDMVKVAVEGPRALVLGEVLIRVSERYRLELHVDIDEANAALLKNGDTVYLA